LAELSEDVNREHFTKHNRAATLSDFSLDLVNFKIAYSDF